MEAGGIGIGGQPLNSLKESKHTGLQKERAEQHNCPLQTGRERQWRGNNCENGETKWPVTKRREGRVCASPGLDTGLS